MNKAAFSHALKRIGAGITAAVTGSVLMLNLPASVLAAEDGEGTTSGGYDYKISDGVVTVTGYSGENRDSITKLAIPEKISGTAVTRIENSAFDGMTTVKTVTIPDTVEFIGISAFSKTAISELKLPSAIKQIRAGFISGCENLKEITIPKEMPIDALEYSRYQGGWGASFKNCYVEKFILEDGIEHVPNSLVMGNEHFKEIVIPASVRIIGANAFCWSDIPSFDVPEGITEIHASAFYGCPNLTEVTLPSTLEKIGKQAFYQAPFSSITLPEGLKEAGSSIFEKCENLKELTIPSTLESAKWMLCASNIETVTFADGLVRVPDYTAAEDYALTKVILPRSITELGSNCFAKTGITEFTVPKQLLKADNSFSESALETVTLEAGLTKIPDYLFQYAKKLTRINWNSDVTEIGEKAFGDCDALEAVEIPDTVTTVGYCAFQYCDILKDVKLPNTVLKLGTLSFTKCNALEYIYIPELALTDDGKLYEYYDGRMFEQCKNLKTVEFAPENKVIPYEVCISCTSLEQIIWPAAPETVQGSAFQNCTALEKAIIPDTVSTIGSSAFRECTALNDLHLPESLTSLGENAFRGTASLRSLYFPHELTSSGSWAFAHSGIETVEIAEGVTKISHIFSYMDELRTVIFPDSLTEIGSDTFWNSTKLTGVTLPPGLETLGGRAFAGCSSLTEITIPKSVKKAAWTTFESELDCPSGLQEAWIEDGTEVIPEQLFRNAENLRIVHIPASVTEIGPGVFANCTSLETVDAPQESLKFWSSTFAECDSLDDERFCVCLKKDSFINCTASADAENKMTHYTVYYSVNPRFREKMSAISLEVKTAWRADIIRESLPENISAGQSGFSFTPEKPEGVIRFSIRTADQEDTSVKVTLSVKQNNDFDWAGWYSKNIVSPGVPAPALSLNAPGRAMQADGKASFTVSGYAPVGQEVTLRITNRNTADTAAEQTVTASPYTGRYTAEIEVAAGNGQILDVEAVCGTLSQKETVICDAGQNKIVQVLMRHNGRTIDMTESFTIGTMPFYSCKPGEPFAFEVRLQNNDCDPVFVSSTVGEKVSVIELKFDGESGAWKGEGHFSSSVPGVLNVLTFPKTHAELAYSRKNSDGTETLEINGHEALEFMKDQPDPVEEFVKKTKGRIVASDDNGIVTTYDLTEEGEELSGIVAYVGQQESVMMNGKAVTPADVAADPEKYGFEAAPLVIADEDGNYRVYLVKHLSGADAVQELCGNLNMDIDPDAEPPQGRPGAYSASYDFDEEAYQREYDRNITPFLRLVSTLGEKSETLSPYSNATILSEVSINYNPLIGPTVNLDKSGTAKSFLVTTADAVGKEKLGQLIEGKWGANGKAFNKWTGKAMSWAECGVAATHMVDQQKKIIGSNNDYVREHEEELLHTSIALTMAKATHILCGGAAIGSAVATGAAAIAGGAAAAPVVLTVGAVIGFVWGVGLLVDKAISIFDETITAGSKVGGDGRGRALIDPSGIAYEFLPSNPVEGATAKIYYQDEKGKAVLWNAEDYDQVNPQITDLEGWYAWDVPEGLWQVRLTKDGYTDAQSEWLPVLPVQVGVNLNMTSELPAKFAGAALTEDGTGIEVKFSKHMQDSTVTAESLSLCGKDSEVIPCSIKPVKEEGNDTGCSMSYILSPKDPCEVYGVVITPDVLTYAGTPFEDGGVGLDGVKIEKAAGIFGDVDGDGAITAYDAQLALIGFTEGFLGFEPEERTLTPEQEVIADVDLDGELTAYDATVILTYFSLKYNAGFDDLTWEDLLAELLGSPA